MSPKVIYHFAFPPSMNENYYCCTFLPAFDVPTVSYFNECVVIRSGEGNGTPLQYSCLENPMDGGAWWAAVHGVMKSQTRLRDFTFNFRFHALKKEMATHSSVLAWRIPGTGEPGGLPSMESHRVGHDWSDLAVAATTTDRLNTVKVCFSLRWRRMRVWGSSPPSSDLEIQAPLSCELIHFNALLPSMPQEEKRNRIGTERLRCLG